MVYMWRGSVSQILTRVELHPLRLRITEHLHAHSLTEKVVRQLWTEGSQRFTIHAHAHRHENKSEVEPLLNVWLNVVCQAPRIKMHVCGVLYYHLLVAAC